MDDKYHKANSSKDLGAKLPGIKVLYWVMLMLLYQLAVAEGNNKAMGRFW